MQFPHPSMIPPIRQARSLVHNIQKQEIPASRYDLNSAIPVIDFHFVEDLMSRCLVNYANCLPAGKVGRFWGFFLASVALGGRLAWKQSRILLF